MPGYACHYQMHFKVYETFLPLDGYSIKIPFCRRASIMELLNATPSGFISPNRPPAATTSYF
jgi:hypothetical protein